MPANLSRKRWLTPVGGGLLALGHLPSGVARRVGRAVGELAFHVDRRHRRIAVRTIQTALPEMPAAERLSLARLSFRHLGAATLEFFSLARITPEELCGRLTLEDWHLFARAENASRGVLIVTAHLGIHELLAPVVALYKGPMHLVARPQENPTLERIVRSMRERFGNVTIPKRSAARGLLRCVGAGGRAAILIDQRVHPNEGVEVPFFGRSTWTSPLPAQISLRTGAPALPVFAFPEAGGRYRVIVRPPIFPEPGATVSDLTASYAAEIEHMIRARPDQWLWMHDRWRRR